MNVKSAAIYRQYLAFLASSYSIHQCLTQKKKAPEQMFQIQLKC